MAENTDTCCTKTTCGCVGYAFVPVQELGETYEPCKALEKGSLFPELELTINEYGKICKSEGGIS